MKRGEGWRGRDLIATASSNKGDSKNNLKEGEGTSSTSANDNGSWGVDRWGNNDY